MNDKFIYFNIDLWSNDCAVKYNLKIDFVILLKWNFFYSYNVIDFDFQIKSLEKSGKVDDAVQIKEDAAWKGALARAEGAKVMSS